MRVLLLQLEILNFGDVRVLHARIVLLVGNILLKGVLIALLLLAHLPLLQEAIHQLLPLLLFGSRGISEVSVAARDVVKLLVMHARRHIRVASHLVKLLLEGVELAVQLVRLLESVSQRAIEMRFFLGPREAARVHWWTVLHI